AYAASGKGFDGLLKSAISRCGSQPRSSGRMDRRLRVAPDGSCWRAEGIVRHAVGPAVRSGASAGMSYGDWRPACRRDDPSPDHRANPREGTVSRSGAVLAEQVVAVFLAAQPVDLVVHRGEADLHGPDVPPCLFELNKHH